MSDERAAFSASYSDFKFLKTRRVAQIVFEVALEHADEAYGVLGGLPDPGSERHFAIAPLKTDAQ